MKATRILAAAAVAAALGISGPAVAHGPGGDDDGGPGPGYGGYMGPGMMGYGGPGYMMGSGMMGYGGPGYMMGRGYMMAPGYGMMGPGMMGPGMMGHGGPGYMMGPGYGMAPGTMGPGYGYAPGPGMGGRQGMGPGMMQQGQEALSTDDVTRMLEQRLAWGGNPNLKVGKVEATDDDTITAEIVTKDGSLVRRFAVNRHTGWMQPVR